TRRRIRYGTQACGRSPARPPCCRSGPGQRGKRPRRRKVGGKADVPRALRAAPGEGSRRRSLDKSYTILVVPDRDARVKKIRVEHRVLVRAALCLGLVLAALAGAMAHYFNVVGKVAENKVLRDENLELQNRWREAEQKFAHINDELDRVKRLNANLRHITQLNDPDRKLSIATPEPPRGGASGGGGPEFVGGGIATEPAQAGM